MLDRERVGLIVSLGIAGRLSTDVELGDVVVPSEVRDYLHRSKTVDTTATPCRGRRARRRDRSRIDELRLGGAAWPTTPGAVQVARSLEFSHPSVFGRWRDEATKRGRALGDVLPAHRRATVHADDAHLATGDLVIASADMRDRITRADRNLLAVEMEAAGVVARATRRPIPVRSMVVRGISDRADKCKSAVDEQTGGRIRRVAMENATSFLLALIETGVLFEGDADETHID